MKLIFVRHGRSVANDRDIFSNRVDQKIQHPLTELGIRQADIVANTLTMQNVTAIYASPIFRAQQTAKAVSKKLGLPIMTEDGLREFDLGELERNSDTASWDRYHTLVDDWFLRGQYDAKIPDYEGEDYSESFNDIKNRFVPLINKIKQTHGANDVIVLVGHGGTYKCMLPLVLDNIGKDIVQYGKIDNTDCVIAETDLRGKLICTSWCGTNIVSAHDTNFFTQPKYDENFNNIRKVEFEILFAKLIEESDSVLIHRQLNQILSLVKYHFEPYLREVVDENSASSVAKEIYDKIRLDFDHDSFNLGSYGSEPKEFVDWLLARLSIQSNNDLYFKIRMCLTAERLYFAVLNQDNYQAIRKELLLPEEKVNDEYKLVDRDDYFSNQTRERISRDPRHRTDNPDNSAVERYQNAITQTTLFGPVPRESCCYKPTFSLSPHARGMDRFRAIEYHDESQNTLVSHARYDLDMPLACSRSQSVRHALQLCKLVIGLNKLDYHYFFLAQTAYLVTAGHHTFHECAYVANQAGLHYKEGNYASILPGDFIEENKAALQELQKQFPELLKINFDALDEDSRQTKIPSLRTA